MSASMFTASSQVGNIQNCPRVKTTQVSINLWINKMYTPTQWTISGQWKEIKYWIRYSMDELSKRSAKWKESVTKRFSVWLQKCPEVANQERARERVGRWVVWMCLSPYVTHIEEGMRAKGLSASHDANVLNFNGGLHKSMEPLKTTLQVGKLKGM